jgi:hypothetical protein
MNFGLFLNPFGEIPEHKEIIYKTIIFQKLNYESTDHFRLQYASQTRGDS